MTVTGEADQGGLEAVSQVDRVPALTGVRALAALLVVATHAAYTTGKYTHGFLGSVYSRLEIGVPIFFVLSGFLLFGPWVKAAAAGSPSPSPGSPLGLVARLQRASVIAWSVGLGLMGFFYGVVGEQAESIFEDNPELESYFAHLGDASITDAFLATSILMMALLCMGFTVSSVLRLRSEEVTFRADLVMATPALCPHSSEPPVPSRLSGPAPVTSILARSTAIPTKLPPAVPALLASKAIPPSSVVMSTRFRWISPGTSTSNSPFNNCLSNSSFSAATFIATVICSTTSLSFP